MPAEGTAYARIAIKACEQVFPAIEELICALPDDLAAAPCAWFKDQQGSWTAEFTVPQADAPSFMALLERCLALAGSGWSARIEPLPDLDWVAASQKGLAPVQAGRFTIHGSHDRAKLPPSRYTIEIDAGLAFGTAHHGSTRGCLLALDRLAKRIRPSRILDLGTGTGVLAIASARTWPAPVLALDTDAEAVAVATANIRLNRAPRSCQAKVGTLHAARMTDRRSVDVQSFDLILANILAEPLVGLANAVSASLAPAGHAVLSGFLSGQVCRLRAAYRARGLVLTHQLAQGDWVTAVFVRRRHNRRRLGPDRRAG